VKYGIKVYKIRLVFCRYGSSVGLSQVEFVGLFKINFRIYGHLRTVAVSGEPYTVQWHGGVMCTPTWSTHISKTRSLRPFIT
jgi:hypothetical protein